MPKVTFIEPGGALRVLEVPVGITLMEAARQNGISGVVALCGGACACATCHVYVDPEWFVRLEPAEDMELGMLESAWEPRTNSRLGCQVHVTAALDGMAVTVPRRQGAAEDG